MRTTGATTGMHLIMGAELNGTSVIPYSEFDWARSTDMGSIFAATTALMTMILVTAHLLSELGALRLVVITARRFNAMHRDVCRRLGLGLRQLPALLQMATAAVGTGVIAMILFMLVRGDQDHGRAGAR